MSTELLINVTPEETRVAIVDNGALQEIHIERSRNRGIVGNIYRGCVVRILPGMQAAFVDVGIERTAFLHASDILQPALACNGAGESAPGAEVGIQDLLHDSQELLVQVLKDPLGTKGARLTTQITIPARHLVYAPYTSHIGVSQRLEDPDSRERLRELVRVERERLGIGGGFIVRTAAEAATESEIRADMEFLRRIWDKIENAAPAAAGGRLVHEDIPLTLRALRDLVFDDVERIRIDSRESYDKARAFAAELIPDVLPRLEHYPGERPLFDLYSVEDEIRRALENRVNLKSGGYVIIEQTEAMTTIDVNTGAFVGRRNLAETLFKTNLEAAQTIARQIRLRNIGGIIIVDFIDMDDAEHRRQVMRALEKALARDRTRTHIADMSTLGLVEITRKRTRESLLNTLCEPCPACGGRGVLKTPQTVCYEIFRELLREARQFDTSEYIVLAAQVVIDMLLDEESASLLNLQSFIGKPVHLQVETTYSQEQFDVVLM